MLHGQQFEEYTGYAYHVRRRLSHDEQAKIGDALDCRGTDEWEKRFEQVKAKLPVQAREMALQERS